LPDNLSFVIAISFIDAQSVDTCLCRSIGQRGIEFYEQYRDIETIVSTCEGESSLFILRASLTMPLADLEFEISESGAGQVDRVVA
jgi:hypothetical protein